MEVIGDEVITYVIVAVWRLWKRQRNNEMHRRPEGDRDIGREREGEREREKGRE